MDASPHDRVFALGERLVDALRADDLEAVARILDERGAALDAASAEASAPPRALAERFRLQDEQIRGALRDRLAATRGALDAIGRAASVHDRYHAPGLPTGQRLDTARRGPDFFSARP